MSNMQLSDKSFTYSITRGAILDVSLTGGAVQVAACCFSGASTIGRHPTPIGRLS
jgi:hypothetical protein